MPARTALSSLVLVPALLACSGDTMMVTSTEATSTEASTASDAIETETETETGANEDLCGNGVLDPGEACEPVDPWCDTCTWDCREQPLPANEWAVELELIDPRAYELGEHWHILAAGPAQLLAVRGTTTEGEAWLYTFTLAGEQVAVAGPAEHGFDTILDHSFGIDGDLALLGRVGESSYVRRMLADGSFEDPIEVPPAPEQVAITTHGFVHLAAGGPAHAVGFAGELSWTRPGPYEVLGNVDDRVVLHSLDDYVEFVAGDGNDVLVWDWWFYPLPEYSRLASTAAVLLAGDTALGYGEAYVNVLDLWTGEETETLLVSGRAGLEVDPGATALDARADGWPLLLWGVCQGGASVSGCGNWESGVGGPGNLEAISLHTCDLSASTRIGADGGVFVVSEQLDGSAALVRRATL